MPSHRPYIYQPCAQTWRPDASRLTQERRNHSLCMITLLLTRLPRCRATLQTATARRKRKTGERNGTRMKIYRDATVARVRNDVKLSRCDLIERLHCRLTTCIMDYQVHNDIKHACNTRSSPWWLETTNTMAFRVGDNYKPRTSRLFESIVTIYYMCKYRRSLQWG